MGGIHVRGLLKRFGGVQALDGIDLDVEPGQVVALLGPNGAGKSTLIRILGTAVLPDEGQGTISDHDVVADSRLSLLGGVYFPLEVLHSPLEEIGEALPFTWAVDALRSGLLGLMPTSAGSRRSSRRRRCSCRSQAGFWTKLWRRRSARGLWPSIDMERWLS